MYIFGAKTESLFDIWSIEHFVSGVTLGSVVCVILLHFYQTSPLDQKKEIMNRPAFIFNYFTIILLLAYIWEVAEFYMEAGYTDNSRITYWFQGVEYWANRIITDPLMVAGGAWVGLHFSSQLTAWSVRSFSALWVSLHVFVFPHCMYMQDVLYKSFSNIASINATLSGVVTLGSEMVTKILG